MNISAKAPAFSVLGALLVTAALPLHSEPAFQSTAPAQEAITTLIASPTDPLPPGTKLRSLTISDGLATADFSPELKANFHGGDTEEAQTVNSVLRTLGRFPTVSRVQILVNGQRVDSLGGLIVISGPLPVIRQSAPAPPRSLHRRGQVQSSVTQR